MSTLFVAAIIIGSVAAVCFILISIHNKHKREAMNNMLKHFSRSATENNLNFSSQEILRNSILALDGVHRKIVVVSKNEDLYSSQLIDLNEVKDCTVKKIYGTIKVGDLKSHKLEQHLEKIVLHFDLMQKPPVEIIFYKNTHNHIYETQELEQKARHWEAILSKMKSPLKNIA
ncbi:MAG TPA: hypothetical protein VNT20_08490 [Flavisolibacter sp.]|jgi:hypothetical protein|nr:hypothetical protein [Flavisolibacter sp.]